MRTSDFDYILPADRIAQTPVEPRHASRLMVLRRDDPRIEHAAFWDLDRYLRSGDLQVFNQTRVLPARLHAQKPTGGRVEILLLDRLDETRWRALVGGKRVKSGMLLSLPGGPDAMVEEELDGARRIIRFGEAVEPYLDVIGEMPLPPYIHTRLQDPGRYQTVFARHKGSSAAPTAGLHFTSELLDKLQSQGINAAWVTLHVGLDTFAPLSVDNPRDHIIHTEWCQVTHQVVEAVSATHTNGGRVIAVGTTSVRALETAAAAAADGELLSAFQGATSLYILPGYKFRLVDAMLTNFHLPRSTLLMMVSAFAGRERILDAYQVAIRENYRFYSFGDAMLIL